MRAIFRSIPNVFLTAAVVLATIAEVAAQNKLEFDVASVRASGQPSQECFGKSLGPGTANPTLLHYGCYSIIPVITDAYGLETYQLINIEKATGIYVEITATMKPGTTKVEMQQMLQNLLADRFHLKTRKEMRDGTVHELSVEKSGSKLKERFDNPPPVDPSSLSAGPLKMAADGMQDYPAIDGHITGGFRIPPKIQAIGTFVTIGELAVYLESRLRAPVIDVTGLKGRYDFRLDYLEPSYDPCRQTRQT